MCGCEKKGGRVCVAVVDDDQDVRKSLKFALELDGLAVCTFAGGAELLESAQLERAECLVVDCRMPGMDGFALLARVAARGKAIPAILITYPVTDQVRRKAEQVGALCVLEKPLPGGMLADTIRKAVGL